MKDKIYIDTNIFVRYFTGDGAENYARACELLGRVERGEMVVWLSLVVVEELMAVMVKYYGVPRNIFVKGMLDILEYAGMEVVEIKKEELVEILEKMLVDKHDFVDHCLAVYAKSGRVVTLDRDLKKIGARVYEWK